MIFYNQKTINPQLVTMATQTLGLVKNLADVDCDKALDEIVHEIHLYLYNFGHHWILFLFGKAYFQKCCRSWVRVNAHLEKFLQDPRSNYSMLMTVLDHEIQKYPQNAFFAKKLKELYCLIAMGPEFSLKTLR